MFLVALNEYDLTLHECIGQNCLHESIHLFTTLCSLSHLANIPFLLFFTKDDLFREKIQHVSLRKCFPEYSGAMDYSESLDFIISKFLAVCEKKPNRILQVFVGNLTDVTFMEDVVSMIKGDALHSYLSGRAF